MAYDVVDATYVLDNLGKMPIIDVRPKFLYDESRIPGAVSVEMITAKQLGGDVAAEMARRAEAVGIGPDDECIVYCQDGILAHEACGYLEQAGYTALHCYEGSFTDWVTDPSRPLED